MIVIVMGVSGAGKTTVGTLLAAGLGWGFADADDYHSAENIEKMRSGTALSDADREPWLAALRRLIDGWLAAGTSSVLACSALKQAYRERLKTSPDIKFVYLKVSPEILRQRLQARHNHYMTDQLLSSQLRTLEEPDDALTVDADRNPQQIVDDIAAKLSLL